MDAYESMMLVPVVADYALPVPVNQICLSELLL